ncbi:hypothetical protein GCM10028777_00270 [Angustibacter speluncae]
MGGDADRGRPTSWAATEDEVRLRRDRSAALVGEVVADVRYWMLDHHREQLAPGAAGPREITDVGELARPTWAHDGADAIDHGVEVATTSGRVLSLTWDPPGAREGIGVEETPMLGSAVRVDADVAVWPVLDRSPAWLGTGGAAVDAVELHYAPWPGGGFWCPRITLVVGRRAIEVLLADVRDGVLQPSADDVAVLHPGTTLPAWAG